MDVLPTVIFVTNLITEKVMVNADYINLIEILMKAVIGDINISPLDIDIGIGEPNRKRWLKEGKCSFLPEEREMLATLKGWGLIDTYRALHPEASDRYSWFDYRSRGFDDNRGLRIDVVLATAPLNALCQASDIDYELRGMEKPSDHCPIWIELK